MSERAEKQRPWKLSEVTLRDVRGMDPGYEVAVLPVGSTEPHNYHLPYGTDFMTVEKIGEEGCRRAWEEGARVVLLPTVPYGLNWNLIKFPMTINVRSTTHAALLRDVVRSLEAHGIRKLVILNGHGGNEFKAMVRDMCAETDSFIGVVDWWKCAPDRAREVFEREGEHAGEMETSVFMALHPLPVRLEQADDGTVRTPRLRALADGRLWITRPWHLLTKCSGHGDPALSSAEKGRRFTDAAVEELSSLLVELSAAEMDETFPYER